MERRTIYFRYLHLCRSAALHFRITHKKNGGIWFCILRFLSSFTFCPACSDGTPAHFRELKPLEPSLSVGVRMNSTMELNKHSGRYPSHRELGAAITGTFVMTTLGILFVVTLLALLLYGYARPFWRRSGGGYPRRHDGFSGARRFNFAEEDPSFLRGVGLEPSVVENLPTFVCKSDNFEDEPLQCAVCLTGLEDGEKARVLPKCNHSFHIECVDTWFRSHSTCPLCRARVHPDSPSNALRSGSAQQSPGSNSMAEDRASSNHSIDVEIHTNPGHRHAETGQTSALAEEDII